MLCYVIKSSVINQYILRWWGNIIMGRVDEGYYYISQLAETIYQGVRKFLAISTDAISIIFLVIKWPLI